MTSKAYLGAVGATALACVGAMVAGAMAAWQVAIPLLAVAVLTALAAVHFRVQAAMALTKRMSRAAVPVSAEFSVPQQTLDSLVDRLAPAIDQRLRGGETNAARLVASTESMLVADLLSLRHRIAGCESMLAEILTEVRRDR